MANQKTPNIKNDVRYTTQETLSTLTGETDNLEKGLAAMQKQFDQIKSSQTEAVSQTQKRIEQQLQELKQVACRQ